MQYREFGHSGIKLSRIGLGCFSMSGAYGAANDAESIATIHQAMERGVNLFDTSARYGGGHNHRLLGEAIKGRRDKVFIHSKTGTIRDDNDRSVAAGSGTPDRLREICELSLKNLGVDYLDAMCQSRVDPTIPIEESVGRGCPAGRGRQGPFYWPVGSRSGDSAPGSQNPPDCLATV